jgi:hypothetical protein
MFNSFLNTFLHGFENTFPVNYRSTKEGGKNACITQGLKISCKQERRLYTLTKNSNDPKAKACYIMHCKIQKKKVTKEAKKQFYDRLIAKSDNKTRT